MTPIQIWAMYYAGLVSIKMHPRNENEHVNLKKLALVADEMLQITLDRWEDKWPGSPQ